ncbi:MAG: ATP-binding protein [Muribaculaceae bacterium]|nr:ATP-binding protein [Muribaculaceae bacterium]
MEQIIGRKEEIARLEKYFQSNHAEFIAVYGRRRVGKTFLVNYVLGDKLAFSMTGVIDAGKESQMHAFVEAMDQYNNVVETPKDWFEAFRMLRHFLSEKVTKKHPCVVFIDELPCFDTRKSNFVEALGHFWNSWASLQPNMLLIVCGSATSWMMDNVIDNHGGLHNRITHEIHLREFSLAEVEEFLNYKGFKWNRSLVLQTYMVMGGIPYYLNLMDNDLSLAQNIDKLFFNPDGEMRREFHRLYKTLFASPEPYIAIVEALFKKKKGLTRGEIAKSVGVSSSGKLTKLLRNLVDCDIVRFYPTKQLKLSSRNGLYQLMDFFSQFYLQFMKVEVNDPQFWTKNIRTPKISTWMGLTFEKVCMAHIEQIKHALRIDEISTTYYSWRSTKSSTTRNAQIDIVIERADKMVNICEAKYSDTPYLLDKEEYDKYINRIVAFQSETKFNGGIIPTFLTSSDMTRNSYYELLGVKHVSIVELFCF